MEFIGQKLLVDKLFSYNIRNLPNPLLLIGPSGCGKHRLISDYARKNNTDIVMISSDVSASDLIDYAVSPVDKIYIINLTDLQEKSQNKFLKFIEEPSDTAHVVLLAEATVGVLPTILNRCRKEYFAEYSKEDLVKLSTLTTYKNEDLFYKLCKTPGDIINYSEPLAEKMRDYIKSTLSRGNSIGLYELLKLSLLINYKEDYDKFDFNEYFTLLLDLSFNNYINKDEFSGKVYFFTSKYLVDNLAKSVNKEAFIINYILNLWSEVYACN